VIDMAMFHSVWTVMLFLSFIGIVAWAWSSRRKQGFDEAARLPFRDDPESSAANAGGESEDG
jgi:cytochrome c oxidase cbb3-type subunit 4